MTLNDSVEEMGPTNVLKLKYDDLACYTDNFSESNFLNIVQFGKLYRGKIVLDQLTLHVMVKIWVEPELYTHWYGDNECRLKDELVLLRHEMLNSHPGMVKLYGYCYDDDDHLGVVYEFDPFDSVHNLVPKDCFTLLQRIKVALHFASLLKFLHTRKCSFYKPFIIRNLDIAHIVVDKDHYPKLCDFAMISGGIFPDRTIIYHVRGSCGYIDWGSISEGVYTPKQDVFAFGVILLNLISKKVFDLDFVLTYGVELYDLAWQEHDAFNKLFDEASESERKGLKFSLFHQSLTANTDFGPHDQEKISELVIDCTRYDSSERPTMKQIVRRLLKLKFVKKHAHVLGVSEVVRKCQDVV